MLIFISWTADRVTTIVLNCDGKIADVGHGHLDTCEVSKPPLDTSNGKIVDSAFCELIKLYFL
jgi:hypothetical protein